MARGRKAAPVVPSNRQENPEQPEFGFDSPPLAPPYDPRVLLDIVEATGALGASIESIVTNTDLRGHLFRPTVDLSAADIDEQLEAAIEYRDGDDVAELTKSICQAIGKAESTVKSEKQRIEKTILREKFILQTFFENCNPRESFMSIREKTRRDLESTGNAYWEVIRDRRGKYQQINWLPTHTMRLHRTIEESVVISETIMISPVQFQPRSSYVHFRKFVQGYGSTRPVYFKEAGDPRLMSSATGKIYETEEEMLDKERNLNPRVATEVIHFRIHNTTSPYGVPRWIGENVSIHGLKDADIVNHDFFNKKTMPPFVIKVMGGRMESDDIENVRREFEDMLMGRSNWHKPLIIQAKTDSSPVMSGLATQSSIEIEPLSKHIQTDGQFGIYSEACINRIGSSMRLPGLLRGDSKDMTRATANATLKFAEQQVFLPIRQSFDDRINKTILRNLGVYYHEFVSRGPELTDPVELIQMLHKSFQGGYLLPDEIRNLAEQAYGVPFREIEAGWSDKPGILVQAGLVAKTHDLNGDPVPVEPAAEPTATAPNPQKAPKPATSEEVTKAWVTHQIEDRVESAILEHDETRIAELAESLRPYFKDK